MSRISKLLFAYRRLATLIFTVFSMIGCSLEDPAISELKRLCEKDGGLEIYGSVEVEGFYDSAGLFGLIQSDYTFIESCKNAPLIRGRPVEHYCHRKSKVKRTTDRCYRPLDERIASFKVDPYPEFLRDHCIAVDRIQKPTAEYGVINKIERWTTGNEVPSFTRSETRIVRMVDEEVLARYVNYSVTRSMEVPVSRSCYHYFDDPPPFKTARVIESVLRPKMK